MALLKYGDPCMLAGKSAERSVYFLSVLLTVLLILFSVQVFAFLSEKFPPRVQSETQTSMPLNKPAVSAPHMVPIYSGNPGGSTSLGGGPSLGGSSH
ncbi:MAG: hypothetical protein DKT66_06090 [Candidatus Melainabacteria bacterium]|nr:MAG: hypothetical protein DKT66_06090 [Candidatus Melainabacteria bacterium]